MLYRPKLWIQNYAEWFRNAWEVSSCSNCVLVRNCGYNVKTDCEKFLHNNQNEKY